MTTTQRCIFCQSPLHTYRHCPITFAKVSKKQMQGKQNYTGQAPNVFVGQYGYPSVNVGILNTEEYTDHDNPIKWSKDDFSIPQIIDLRTSLVNARSSLAIKSPSSEPPKGFSSRFLDITKEVSLAKTTADVEFSLEKKPTFKTQFQERSAPHGPNVGVKKAELESNPTHNQHMEKAANDTDLLATDAVTNLFSKGVDEHAITKAFSVGNFGLGTRRKLVPTKWSITAVDDTLGKQLVKEIKTFPESDCVMYLGGYFGNYYCIMFFDDFWQYELYEQYVPQIIKKRSEDVFVEYDYEPNEGMKEYAKETVGGFYATRLAVLEKLRSKKRQASVSVIRVITEEYTAPLGVWVVREAVRKTLMTKPISFPDRETMILYAKKYFLKEFSYDITLIHKRSQVLQNLREQTKLKKWF